jgi:hypothetical protein
MSPPDTKNGQNLAAPFGRVQPHISRVCTHEHRSIHSVLNFKGVDVGRTSVQGQAPRSWRVSRSAPGHWAGRCHESGGGPDLRPQVVELENAGKAAVSMTGLPRSCLPPARSRATQRARLLARGATKRSNGDRRRGRPAALAAARPRRSSAKLATRCSGGLGMIACALANFSQLASEPIATRSGCR